MSKEEAEEMLEIISSLYPRLTWNANKIRNAYYDGIITLLEYFNLLVYLENRSFN